MRTAIIMLVSLSACLFILQDTSFGHGGQWIPPNDIVPPNMLGPGMVTPPSSTGPVTPGPIGPTGVGPSLPGMGSGTGALPKIRGARTGGAQKKRNTGGEGFERWEFWWENNKWPHLDLRNHLNGPVNYSGSSTFLSGRGLKAMAFNSKRPTPEMIQSQVIPSLRNALDEADADILDSSVLALARIVEAEKGLQVLRDIQGLLKSTHNTVQQSAALSLGVLDAHQAVPYLRELLINSKDGQAFMGRHEVPEMVRAFAALSLGLINTADCADQLMRVVRLESDKNREVKVCSVIALGLMKNNPKRDEIQAFLAGLINNAKLDSYVRAAIPTSLGKLQDPVALSTVARTFKTERRNNFVLQSCAIAMGQLASIRDRVEIELLMKYIRDGNDEQTRHFAFIALGQIGAREEGGPEDRETHQKIHTFFLKQIMNPRRATHLPWAALGAALHAQGQEIFRKRVIDKVTNKFDTNKNPSYRGAMAIALGLLKARGQAEMLYKEFLRSHEDLLKGYICVALGMMDYKSSAESIRNIVAASNVTYRLRLEAATALGLMGDAEAVSILVKTLKESRTMCVTSSAVKALGLIGDRSAIMPLRDILENPVESPLARAFSAVALGLIGEKTALPWNSVISENLNYRAMVSSIREVLDIL